MKLISNIISLFILAIFIEQTRTQSTRGKTKLGQKSKFCETNANGQMACICGQNRQKYNPRESYCRQGKLFARRNTLIPLQYLREVKTPIHTSTSDIPTKITCKFFFIVNETTESFVPLKNISVDASIDHFAADVTLTQIYVNHEENPINTVYAFPIEENAAVYSFTAQIGNRTITALLKEKQVAEREYQDAVQQGYSAVLMRQSSETLDTFRIDIGLIPPGQECIITIKYVAELELIDGKSSRFVVPTTITPRYNPKLGVVQSPDRTGAQYVKETTYSISLKTRIQRGLTNKIMKVANMSHPVNISVTDETIDLSLGPVPLDRDIIFDIDLPESRPTTLVSIEKYDQPNQYAALISFVPKLSSFLKNAAGNHETNAEFIFIIDCSGSMSADNRIAKARQAMTLFLRSLPVGSHFNIIRFGSKYDVLFNEESMTVVYDEKTSSKAGKLIEKLNADFGGTELLETLQYLHSKPTQFGRSRQVFLLTDGEISNTDEVIELTRRMSSTTRIFSFGIGDSPSRSLVKGLARATNGHAVFVPPGTEVDMYVAQQLGRALQPSHVNAKIRWNGLSSVISQSPKTIPPLYVDDRVLVYAMFTEDDIRSKKVSVDISVADEHFETVNINTEMIRDRGILRRLAAKALIQELQHEKPNDSSENGNKTKNEIKELSLKHGILSTHTAFVGVERDGPVTDSSQAKTRTIPIQLSKDSQESYHSPMMYYMAPHGIPFGAQAMTMSQNHRNKANVLNRLSVRPIQHIQGFPGLPGRGPSFATPAMMADSVEEFDMDSEPITTTTEYSTTDDVRWLINIQSFNGSWALRDHQVARLLSGKSIESLKITGNYAKDILTTALAVAFLDLKHIDKKVLWTPITRKARIYLLQSGITDKEIDQLINEIKQKI